LNYLRSTLFVLLLKNASIASFEWLKQLRYYYEQESTIIRMANAQYTYGYEYLGASDRLVITPLTVC
jgi:dynein heavy chain